MGLLRKILTVPVSAPMSGTLWIASKLQEATEQEVFDPGRIRSELDRLEQALEAGKIDEDAFDEAEEILMARLTLATERTKP